MTIHLNNLLLILSYYQFFIISLLFSFLVVTFILDGFRFSKNIYIKYLQYIILFYMVFILIKYILFLALDPMNFICYLGEEGHTIDIPSKTQGTSVNSNVTLQPSVSISTKGAEIIADSIRSGASQIGLSASIGGVAAAVGAGLSKTPASPGKKAGLIVLGGIAGGTVHTGATALNQIRLEHGMRVRKRAQEEIKGTINSGKGPSPSGTQQSSLNETNITNNSTNTSSKSSNLNPKISDSYSSMNLNQSNLKPSSNTDFRLVQVIDDKQIDSLNSSVTPGPSYFISSQNKGDNSGLSFDYIEKFSLDILKSNPSINYDNLHLRGPQISDLGLIKNTYGLDFTNFSQTISDNPMEALLQSINMLAFLNIIFAILLAIDLIMLYLLRSEKLKK
jgi:hypothetical protein